MNCFDEQERYVFRPITENPLVLDFGQCRTLGEIHLLLKKNLVFLTNTAKT